MKEIEHKDSLDDLTEGSRTPFIRVVLVTIIVGLGSGFLGMLLALLLHYLQHIAYGYSPLHIISTESFLQGISASSPERRIIILVICGLVAGLGWGALYHFGKPLVSIAQAIKTNKVMPKFATIVHALLQIITIALGSPLGREVAPREMGAVFASWIATKLGLTATEIKIMIACGAGAGLAAVYNLPLGGAIFALEVLLCNFSWSMLLPALASSAIAVVISWSGLGNESMYHIPDLMINTSLVLWAIISGPIIGVAAFGFIHIASLQREKALRGWPMVFACLLNFTFIGLLALYFPVLLGNGKSAVQLEFADSVGIGFSVLLLLLRTIIVWTSLGAGAQGGLLTPSLANGALLGVILGGFWNWLWPNSPLEAFAIIGATAFLAAAQKMPLTAIIIIFEFTRLNFIFLIPIMFAVYGALGAAHGFRMLIISRRQSLQPS